MQMFNLFAFASQMTGFLYIANNPGSGYVNRVFDSSLGYFFYFQVDGGYIYAERV